MAEAKFFRGDVSAPQRLDDYGRCCGRKPLIYKREGHRFCDRCCRSYHLHQDFQIDNWAWKRRVDGQFEYVTGKTRIGATLGAKVERLSEANLEGKASS